MATAPQLPNTPLAAFAKKPAGKPVPDKKTLPFPSAKGKPKVVAKPAAKSPGKPSPKAAPPAAGKHLAYISEAEAKLLHIVDLHRLRMQGAKGPDGKPIPDTFDPGGGHPLEFLTKLTPEQIQIILDATDGKASKGQNGVPSYAEGGGSNWGPSSPGNGFSGTHGSDPTNNDNGTVKGSTTGTSKPAGAGDRGTTGMQQGNQNFNNQANANNTKPAGAGDGTKVQNVNAGQPRNQTTGAPPGASDGTKAAAVKSTTPSQPSAQPGRGGAPVAPGTRDSAFSTPEADRAMAQRQAVRALQDSYGMYKNPEATASTQVNADLTQKDQSRIPVENGKQFPTDRVPGEDRWPNQFQSPPNDAAPETGITNIQKAPAVGRIPANSPPDASNPDRAPPVATRSLRTVADVNALADASNPDRAPPPTRMPSQDASNPDRAPPGEKFFNTDQMYKDQALQRQQAINDRIHSSLASRKIQPDNNLSPLATRSLAQSIAPAAPAAPVPGKNPDDFRQSMAPTKEIYDRIAPEKTAANVNVPVNDSQTYFNQLREQPPPQVNARLNGYPDFSKAFGNVGANPNLGQVGDVREHVEDPGHGSLVPNTAANAPPAPVGGGNRSVVDTTTPEQIAAQTAQLVAQRNALINASSGQAVNVPDVVDPGGEPVHVPTQDEIDRAKFLNDWQRHNYPGIAGNVPQVNTPEPRQEGSGGAQLDVATDPGVPVSPPPPDTGGGGTPGTSADDPRAGIMPWDYGYYDKIKAAYDAAGAPYTPADFIKSFYHQNAEPEQLAA